MNKINFQRQHVSQDVADANSSHGPDRMAPLTVVKIAGLAALDAHREKYQSLLNSLGRADTFYFDREFMAAVNPSFLADDSSGRSRELYFLLAFRGDELIGVAPFVRERKRLTRFGVKRIYNYGETNDSLMVSFPQCLALVHEKSACIAAFVQYLDDHSRDWDIVDLGYLFLPEEIEAYRELTPECVVEPDLMKCHAADLQDGFDSYIQSFSPKHRRNFRRSREKLEASHRDVRFMKTEQLTPEQLLEIEQLHIKRQQTLRQHGVSRNSMFELPAQKQSFLDCDQAMSRKQLGRHYLLYADDRLIAFQLCYRNRNTTYFQLIAMDDDFRQYSPAKLLVLFAYEQEAQDGVQEINLLLGTNPLKAQFGKQVTDHFRVSWQNRRLSSAVRVGLLRASQQIKGWLHSLKKNVRTKRG